MGNIQSDGEGRRVGFSFTGVLEALQLVQGLIDLALESSLVTDEVLPGLVTVIATGNSAGTVTGPRRRAASILFLRTEDSLQAPGARNDTFDKNGFKLADRLKLGHKVIPEVNQQTAIFAGEQDVVGKDAVRDGVETGDGLTGFGLNTAFEGVLAISFSVVINHLR